MKNAAYPGQVRHFIAAYVDGHTTQQIADALNNQFGTAYTVQQIAAYKKNHHLVSNIDARIKPGHIPYNKGVKGVCAPGSEKGWFKPGHKPHNHLPVGTELVNADGYLSRKLAEPNVWKPVHIIMWCDAYGPIPAGSIVCFTDGNPRNVCLENLHLETRAENAVINRCGLRSADAELSETGLVLAKVKIATAEAKRKLKSKRIKEEVEN